MPERGDQEELSETEKFNNQLADNDWFERCFKLLVNLVIMCVILIILSIVLFKGTPDLVDGIINILNRSGDLCQKH